jgi:UDP-N-acetylmuramoylalanine--D-glutamate ligase
MNFSPDHIDRHGSMENYIAAKKSMFRDSGKAVIGVDDEYSLKMAQEIAAEGLRHVNHIAVTRTVERGVYADHGKLFDAIDGGDPIEVADLSVPTLPGAHNHQNAAAAYTACRLLGIAPDDIIAALRTFPGLPHRQFLTRVINGVAYINDSKATNADAAARALACYKSIYWILGGKAKDGGLDGLEPYMDRIKEAFVIGDAAEDFADWLKKHNVTTHMCGTLDRAVREAHEAAQAARGEPGGVGAVLLSPACASFDQFKNFEDRGDQFAHFVNTLPED